MSLLPVLSLSGCVEDIEVQLGEVPATMEISSDCPEMSVSEDGMSAELLFYSEGGSALIEVNTTDRDWKAVQGGDASWLKMERNAMSLMIEAMPNETDMRREQNITLYAGSGENEVKAVITVRQGRPGSEFEIGENEIMFGATPTEPYLYEVNADGDDWDFSTGATWILAEKSGESALSIMAEANTGSLSRSEKIFFYYGDDKSDTTNYIIVTQAAGTQLSVDKSVIVFDENGGEASVNVSTNYGTWSASSDGDWVALEQNGNTLNISVGSNSDVLREARITVVSGEEGSEAVRTVTVSQISVDPEALVLRVEPVDFDWNYNINSPTVVLNLAGDLDCTVNWGDGTVESVRSANPHHTYPVSGTYYVTVTGRVPELNASAISQGYRKVITGIKSWGNTGLVSMSHAFDGCGITEIPEDSEGAFAEVTDFSYAFANLSIRSIPEGLFAHAGNAVSFANVFEYSSKLTSVPEGLFSKAVKAEDFSNAFGNSMLSSVPERLFANNPEIRSVNGIFFYCIALRSVPEGLFAGCTKIENFNLAFSRCWNLSSVPAGLFRNCTNAKSFNNTFEDTPITVIPDGLFSNCRNAVSFDDTFASCTGLRSIPENIFSNCTEAVSFYGTFRNCTGITEIPESLFYNNLKAESFDGTFSGLSSITAIPSGLFAKHPGITGFQATFANCTSLTDIPEDLFANNTAVKSFDRTFMVCTSLTAIPEGLFARNTAAEEFFGTFSSCSAVTSIPEDLFANNAEARIFQNTFASWRALVSVPEGLFRNCPKAESMNGTFGSCTSLASLPEGLFAGNPDIWDFTGTFSGCTALEGIPAGLFDNNRNVTSFGFTFSGCANVTGESPYTVIDGEKIHLYERENYPDLFVYPNGKKCYFQCTQLSDYPQIPRWWKEE